MRKYFLSLLFLLILIIPISGYVFEPAGNYSRLYAPMVGNEPNVLPFYYESSSFSLDFGPDGTPGELNFYIPPDSTGSFTITLYNNQEITGTWSSIQTYILFQNITITIDSVSHSILAFVSPINIPYISPALHIEFRGFTIAFSPVIDEVTNETGMYIAPTLNDFYYFISAPVKRSPIRIVAFISTKPAAISGYAINLPHYIEKVEMSIYEKLKMYKDAVFGFFGVVWMFINPDTGIPFYFKFIFIDNLLLILGLFELAIIALSISQSADVFEMIKKWWDAHDKLIHFMIGFVETILSLVEKIKNIIWPI